MNAVNSSEQNWSRFGHLVVDMQMILQFLSSWKCCHVTVNNANHRLARLAIQRVTDHREEISEYICNVILMEQFALSFD